MRSFSILFSLLLFVFTLTFVSCKKQDIEPLSTDIRLTDSENFTPSKSDVVKRLKIDFQNRAMLVNTTITIPQGYVATIDYPKSFMNSNKAYIVRVTPNYGNPDLYVYGHSPYSQISSSKNYSGVDEAGAHISNLSNGQNKVRYFIYAKTATNVKVEFYTVDASDCFNTVPLHQQPLNSYQCGQHSVQMVLDYYGPPENMADIFSFMGTNTTNANNRESAIEHFNSSLSASVGYNWTFEQLKSKVCEGKPVIADIWRHNYPHSVVITRIDADNTVYFNDPYPNNNGGYQNLSKSEFLNFWNLNNYLSETVSPNIVTYIN